MAPLTLEQKASRRRWSARGWWLGMHIYDYAVLIHSGVLHTQPTSDLVLLAVVATANLISYVVLQRSDPGFLPLEHKPRDLEANADDSRGSDVTAEKQPLQEEVAPTDADLLVPRQAADNNTRSTNDQEDCSVDGSPARICDVCNIPQPMRTKHCKFCRRCVRQYDHHCDCAGTCVGQQNRHLFLLYLCLQVFEGILAMGLVSSSFKLKSSVDEWFSANILYILAWFSLFCVLLLAIPLGIYQLFLVSTNQTSWEHARRSNITYLQTLPDEVSPFDRGLIMNWWVFLSRGDANKWVHSSVRVPPPGSPSSLM